MGGGKCPASTAVYLRLNYPLGYTQSAGGSLAERPAEWVPENPSKEQNIRIGDSTPSISSGAVISQGSRALLAFRWLTERSI